MIIAVPTSNEAVITNVLEFRRRGQSAEPIKIDETDEIDKNYKIDKNENLGDAAKFNHLRKSLVGEASNCIKGLLNSKENYEAAKAALVHEYGNDEKLK